MMKKLQFFICTMAILLCTTALQAQVAVNTSGGNPHVSAMLDVQSTSKGFLLPRLTTAQRTALAGTATPGLMVYDTSLGKFFYFTGSGWTEGSVGGLWTKTGSYTNLTNLGDFVGIGTTSPSRTLEVSGNARTLRLTSPTAYSYMEFISTHATDWAFGVGLGTFRMVSTTDNFTSSTAQYLFGTSYFHPYSNNAKELGISAYRWKNLYSYDGNFADDVTVSDDLWVSGSMGVGTTSPDRTFEVVGPWETARLTSSNSGAMLEFVSTQAADWAITTWVGNLYLLSSSDDFASKTDEYIISTTSLSPVSDNVKSLGKTSVRWNNLYSYDGDFSDDVTISDDLFVASSIGVGNILPQYDIDISPSSGTAWVRAKSADSYAGFIIDKGGTTENGYIMYKTLGSDKWYMGMIDNDNFAISTSYSSPDGKFYITSTGQVCMGTTSPATGYKLSVDGKIMCEEVRVDMSPWADYVFARDYKLMSIKELDTFIQDNGHLPNIPSAEEIQTSGLEIGEMQRLMMEKIEELSLYIIQQQKQIEELKEQITKNQN